MYKSSQVSNKNKTFLSEKYIYFSFLRCLLGGDMRSLYFCNYRNNDTFFSNK